MSDSEMTDEYDLSSSSSSEEESTSLSALIHESKKLLNNGDQQTMNGMGSSSGGVSSLSSFVNPIDRMINLEADDESQSSYTSSNNYYREVITNANWSDRFPKSRIINSENLMMEDDKQQNVASSSDESDSSEMDESDTTEEEDEIEEEEEEDEENADLREWQICFPLNTSTLYASTNSYFESSLPNTTQPIDISHEDTCNRETIFSIMPKNLNLIGLIGSDSPIIDYSYVLQTRSDDPTIYVPENLYTSLVYQFHQSILFHEKIRKKYDKIVADIKLCFRDTGEEVQKIVQVVEMNQTRVPANLIPEKQGGVTKDVISGDIKGLELLKPLSQREDPNSIMENRTKFNIDVVSAHYKNRAFTIQIRYFFPEDYNESDELPFCIVQGAPFLTSARRKKPQRTAESKKRKKLQRLIDMKRARLQEIHGPNTSIQVPTPQSTQPVSTIEDFSKGLRELIYFVALLPQNEKQQAIDTALKKLVQNDKDI